MSPSLVILAAGGTGGHLFPAEALARELLNRGIAVALITDRRGKNFPVEGVPTYRVPAGRSGAGLLAKLRMLIDLGLGVLAARRLLKRLRPMMVIGFGGYPSLPTMLAACHLRLPTALHEQNAVLGRANQALARRVGTIATAFATVSGLDPALQAKIRQTGNPVRPAILALRDKPYRPIDASGVINLLVIGGSQGARILSRTLPAAFKALPAALKTRLRISQQVRAEDEADIAAAYADSGLNIESKRFFDDIPARLDAAQLVIARAGGSTTAELTAAGRPAILVPFAAAIADEQTANARILADQGAAWLLPEAEFTPSAVTDLLTRLLTDPARLTEAARAAWALGNPGAAARLADLVTGPAFQEARS